MKEFLEDFQDRVKKIAFTDSVHNLDLQHVSHVARRYITRVEFNNAIIKIIFIIQSAINWVTSEDPLDEPQPSSRSSVKRLSAG